MKETITRSINDSYQNIKNIFDITDKIESTIQQIIFALKNGNKIILFGNGGSAADAQHIAAEMIGRFKLERKSFPAIALTTDSSILTALANDYSFDCVFSRQCESLVNEGDIVIGISTSGKSINVINGLKTSKAKGAVTVGLLGNNGGTIKQFTDISIIVKSNSTPRIQEAHRVIYHIICDLVESELIRTN